MAVFYIAAFCMKRNPTQHAGTRDDAMGRLPTPSRRTSPCSVLRTSKRKLFDAGQLVAVGLGGEDEQRAAELGNRGSRGPVRQDD